MNLLKKISGSFLLGLAVIGLALGTSAFIETSSGNDKFVGEIYVNTDNNGEFEKLPSSGDYLEANCLEDNNHPCAWERTSTPGTVPNDFNAAQADSLEQLGLIQQKGSLNGIYEQ